jgi:hypothetical protein
LDLKIWKIVTLRLIGCKGGTLLCLVSEEGIGLGLLGIEHIGSLLLAEGIIGLVIDE